MKVRHILLMALVYIAVLIGAYSLVWFHYHDSLYAEACPEQKTLLWCK